MNNIVLSPNVKQTLIDTLKGLGLHKIAPQIDAYTEMSEADIALWLDDPTTTTDDVFDRIKLAVLQQIQNDAKSKKFLQSNTAFHRHTMKSVLMNIADKNHQQYPFRGQAADLYLRHLTAAGVDKDGNIGAFDSFQLDVTAGDVISMVYAGTAEKNLTDDEHNEAAWFWNEVQYAGYRKWLINEQGSYQPHLPYNQQTPPFAVYHREKLRAELLVRTTACCNQDVKMAQSILDYKITKQEIIHKFAADDQLWRHSRQLCELQGKNPDTDLTMADVLAAMSDESAKTRLLTFFQTRSREQKTNAKKLGINRQNKIGNVMGETGRKLVKAATGQSVAVDFDTFTAKKGKGGPWRGYKPMYDRILAFLTNIYSNIPVIGFVQQLLERHGVVMPSATNQIANLPRKLESAWETDYRKMPADYTVPAQDGQTQTDMTLNVAGEFYNKAKARLLADKMRLQNKQAEICDDYTQANPNLPELKQQVAYLQQRIVTAEQILQQMPPKNTSEFHDPRYFAMLEDKILAQKENKDNAGVNAFLDTTKNHSANDEMIDALQQFNLAVQGTTTNQQAAKRAMAVEMFHLRGQMRRAEDGTNQVMSHPQAVLDGITERFVQSGALHQMVQDLKQLAPSGQQKRQQNPDQELNSQDYAITAVDVNAAIDQFVRKDLQQNAAKTQYDTFMANQARSKILDAVIAER
ncbi:MAG: hypothetical protein NC133_04190 [Prevotella sp.]|nr:hypothetical protein [Prevotella sp.]